jgi:hypothetical protein
MPLPDFDSQGELPAGVHQATLDEIIARFGSGTPQRQAVTTRLLCIYNLLTDTGKLEHLIIFGSYVTTKPNPNDVDLVLVLADDFNLQACDEETRRLFEHMHAAAVFGASIFWMRPSMLLLESLDEFIAHWQIKRDRTRRGIVEVRP